MRANWDSWVGATRPDDLRRIRNLAPESWFLVPGVGAQGGTVEEVAEAAFTDKGGLLVNSSRGIIYASSGLDFDKAAREAALKLQEKMSGFVTGLE